MEHIDEIYTFLKDKITEDLKDKGWTADQIGGNPLDDRQFPYVVFDSHASSFWKAAAYDGTTSTFNINVYNDPNLNAMDANKEALPVARVLMFENIVLENVFLKSVHFQSCLTDRDERFCVSKLSVAIIATYDAGKVT